MTGQEDLLPAGEGSGTDEANRETARRLELDNPGWIVVFGAYTRQFVAFPRFRAPARTIIAAMYPAALPARMREVEGRFNMAEPQREVSPLADGRLSGRTGFELKGVTDSHLSSMVLE